MGSEMCIRDRYLVQPPGTMTRSIFACASSCLMLSVMRPSNESQANIRRENENSPNTPCTLACEQATCTHSRVSSSFIHPFTEATKHLFLNSSLSCFVSLLAPGKKINGLRFVQSAFAAKQTETLDFSCPVVFSRIDFSPTLSTVVLDSISCQTAVSSMAIMSL